MKTLPRVLERTCDIRIGLGVLAVAFLAFGCISSSPNASRSITGPSTMALSAPSADMSRASWSGDEGKDKDKDNKGKGKSDAGSLLLKSAAGFAVFAFSTVTSTGPTVVNGDLGLNTGVSVTGFPPGTLNGTLHINDGPAVQAKLDLQAAYNDLVGRGCNTSEPNLNSTLTPGVYCFASSAQLNTALVLDGRGNRNALFIFQIGSTLTTASNSSVTLINGASAGNVFWLVGSSATLGTNTAFQGTIIAYSSVGLNTGASIVTGRAMALNGAVTLDSNVITVPSGRSNGGGGGHGGDDENDDHDGHHHGHGGDDGDDDGGGKDCHR